MEQTPIRWYVDIDGRSIGPIDRPEIQNLIEAGDAGPGTLAWGPELPDWQPIQEIHALRDLLIFRPPPPLPADRIQLESRQTVADLGRSNPPNEPPQREADLGDPPPIASASARQSIAPVARLAIWSLYGMAVLGGVATVSSIAEVSLIDSLAAGEFVPEGQIAASDERQALIDLLFLVGFFATAVLFIRWLRKVYDEAATSNRRALRYGRGWTIGGWFIPIGFLYIPFRIIEDVVLTRRPAEQRLPSFIKMWWGFWLTMNFLEFASLRFLNSEEVFMIQTASVLGLLSDLTVIPAALLAVRLIRLAETPPLPEGIWDA